jgi:hypothetical protein
VATLCAAHVRTSDPWGPLDAFHTAKPGNSEGIVMNIALNPETAADKSCQTYPKTIGQFEALPRAGRQMKGIGQL